MPAKTQETKPLSPTSKPITVDQFLRDFSLLRDLYDRDAKFAARVDAAVVVKNSEAHRRTWAEQLGIDALAHPKEILNALAAKLGLKRAGRPAAATSHARKTPVAKPGKRGASQPKAGGRNVDTGAMEGQILSALKAGPITSEALRKQLGAPRPLYKKAADKLLTEKKIKKSGERRHTAFRLA